MVTGRNHCGKDRPGRVMYYLDLFSGIGGFALGARMAGMEFEKHFFSEIEPYSIRVYNKHFQDAINIGNILEVDPEDLPRGDWIITGGFPCQDISIAGKGKGLIDVETNEVTRSGLWFRMREFIRILRPRFTIIENVGALVNWFDETPGGPPQNTKDLDVDRWSMDFIQYQAIATAISDLAEIGYNAEWQDIRAEDVGAPHRRERIWIIAYPGFQRRESGPGDEIQSESQKSIRENSDDISGKRPIRDEISDPNGERCEKLHNRIPEGKGDADCNSGGGEIPDSDGEQSYRKRRTWNRGTEFANSSWWEVEPGMGRVVTWIPSRVDRLRGLGNSIVPQIAALLFLRIKELL